ncbi:hypothetical protein ACPOL_6558 [Acidisarcina polymorpha]|uniref:Uncharacterized protein n=1 Tax=Acidisarcina polymorpha TaxID=2211140 RepID=A0A2Z5G9V1_9BACT|nr:hypothetical protein ACPOL_6558 [Acidisarcina polymorpha]
MEKDWCVVANKISVSPFGVELESKAPDITLRIGCTTERGPTIAQFRSRPAENVGAMTGG